MAQHLNLNDPRFAPRRVPWTAAHGLAATVGVFGLTGLLAMGLSWLATRAEADTRLIETGTAALRSQTGKVTASPMEQSTELTQLKATEQSQARIRAALEAGIVGNRQGHAEYLAALARRATGNVWITRFQVSEDGNALVLEGRMANTTALSDYLRQLNSEPRFKGRPFAQLQVRAVVHAPGTALPAMSEFVLRSQPIDTPMPPQPGASAPAGAGSGGGGSAGNTDVAEAAGAAVAGGTNATNLGTTVGTTVGNTAGTTVDATASGATGSTTMAYNRTQDRLPEAANGVVVVAENAASGVSP